MDKLTLDNQKRNLQQLLFDLEAIKRKKINLENQEKILKKNLLRKQKALKATLKENGLIETHGGFFLEGYTEILDEEAKILLEWRE